MRPLALIALLLVSLAARAGMVLGSAAAHPAIHFGAVPPAWQSSLASVGNVSPTPGLQRLLPDFMHSAPVPVEFRAVALSRLIANGVTPESVTPALYNAALEQGIVDFRAALDASKRAVDLPDQDPAKARADAVEAHVFFQKAEQFGLLLGDQLEDLYTYGPRAAQVFRRNGGKDFQAAIRAAEEEWAAREPGEMPTAVAGHESSLHHAQGLLSSHHGPTVERADPRDAGVLADISRKAFAETQLQTSPEEFRKAGYENLVVRENFVPVAFLRGEFKGAAFHVNSVAAKRDVRRSGYGRALLLEAFALAKAKAGTNFVTLEVSANNEPALALYRSLGFEEDPSRRQPGYYADKSDALFLRARVRRDVAPPPP